MLTSTLEREPMGQISCLATLALSVGRVAGRKHAPSCPPSFAPGLSTFGGVGSSRCSPQSGLCFATHQRDTSPLGMGRENNKLSRNGCQTGGDIKSQAVGWNKCV